MTDTKEHKLGVIQLTGNDLEQIMVALEARRNEILDALQANKANTSIEDLKRYARFSDTYYKLATYAVSTELFHNVGQTVEEMHAEKATFDAVLTGMIALKKVIAATESKNG